MNVNQTTAAIREDADDEPEQPPSPGSYPNHAQGLSLEVNDETERLTAEECARLAATLRSAVTLALEPNGSNGAHDVRVAVIGDYRMGQLHLAHSGIEGTTDVLTFDMREDDDGPLDVDLAVCLDEAERESAERAHGAVDELVLYALHGVLHCLGYDDHDGESFEAMHAREDEILRAIGLGATFSDDSTGGSL